MMLSDVEKGDNLMLTRLTPVATLVTARTQWSAYTQITLTRMTSWCKPAFTYGLQSRV